uniref:Integrase catalytic domain-containing protein n=1 Tax=Meloidogyne enterolobii TaxID=390850 RepID=A0A6V7VNL9_MELEN|nr:unnamed protein product [Meloidogyne enterolobii]
MTVLRLIEFSKIRGQYLVKHIASEENPADLCSRGTTPSALQKNIFWWNGPGWLSDRKEFWVNPKFEYIPGTEKIDEEIMEAIIEQEPIKKSIIIEKRFSNYWRLIRALAYAFRFLRKIGIKIKWKGILGAEEIKNLKNNLSTEELKFARNYLIIKAQEAFPPEDERKRVLNMIKIQGIWICQGRIKEAEIPNEAILPIYLPKEAWLTKLIIINLHKMNNHCGTQILLGIIRMNYWIPQGRRAVREVLNSARYGCLICRKFNLQPYALKRFDLLPKERINVARPFNNVGIDFFGPMTAKIQDKPEKVYGALFTCMVIRAVHIELAYDLSGVSFLQAYRRFIARRGIPSIVFSDNATNFQFGAKIIKKLSDQTWCTQEVQQWIVHKGTQWKFTTPRNPREGGAWERMIGVVKNALKRSVGKKLLDHVELATLFSELEAMVNSRPLTYQSDGEPLRAIRPIDFLIPYAPVEINFANIGEDSDYEEEMSREKGLKNMREINKKLNKFWDFWKSQYLLSLRERGEKFGKNTGKEPQVGEVVIVEEDLPRPLWKLARIIDLIRGRDGIIRTVKLNILGKIFKRSITQIFPLELSSEQQITRLRQPKDRNLEEEMDSSSEEDTPFPARARPTKKLGRPTKVPEIVMMATMESSLPPTMPAVRDLREERILKKSREEKEREEEEIQILEAPQVPILPGVRDKREDRALKEARKEKEEQKRNGKKRKMVPDLNLVVEKRGGKKYSYRKYFHDFNGKFKIPFKPIIRYGRVIPRNSAKPPGVNMLDRALASVNASNARRERLIAEGRKDLDDSKFYKTQDASLKKYQKRYDRDKHDRWRIKQKEQIATLASRRERQVVELKKDYMWPAPEIENEVWGYDIFSKCEGPNHLECIKSTTSSRTAHSRRLPIQVTYPIMTTLVHYLVFNWFGRQKFGNNQIWEGIRDQFCKPELDPMWLLVKFWQYIKLDPKKAFKDRFLIDILVLRRMNCKVFQHQFNYHWNGQIKLQEPPKTPIEELNEWASYITRMFSKLLTKRNYQRCKGNTTLRLYEAPFIIAADASIQSVVNWCENPADCRLVYFDGGSDLHTIIYFGIKTTDLFIVVKPDEEIMASIDRSLKFWRRAGVPIKITLIHNENKIYLERKKYEEQFLNMAESYNTGYLYYNGQFKNLKKAKGKILGETYIDEDSEEEPGPMAQKVKPAAPKNNLQQPLPPQQPQQQQIIQQQEMLPISAQPQVRPPLEERLKELLQRIQQRTPSTSASNNNLQQQPSTSTQSTSRQSGSLLKNLGTLALIVLIICCLFGLTTQEVTRTRVRTPAGSKTVYKVRASPQMLQTYKEQHQEIDRFRRKNIINEIKNGEPVFWCATQSSALWKFPSKEEATFCNKDKFRKWKNFGFETYSQITHPEPVEGLICSAKYTKETYYTNFLGDKFLRLEQNLLPISKEDCLKMRENKICPLNKKNMEKKDGMWKN